MIVATFVGAWPTWRSWLVSPPAGVTSEDQFCAVMAAAQLILHELTHICVDGFGGGHFPDGDPLNTDGCWDAARMMDTAWQYAMSQRYPCMVAAPMGKCACAATKSKFVGSYITGQWGCP